MKKELVFGLSFLLPLKMIISNSDYLTKKRILKRIAMKRIFQ